MSTSGRPIIVTGDLTIDWGLREETKPQSRDYEDRLRMKVQGGWMGGGAFLMAGMVREAIRQNDMYPEVEVAQPDAPTEKELKAFNNPYQHSFAVLTSYYAGSAGEKRVRIRENLGFGGIAQNAGPDRFKAHLDHEKTDGRDSRPPSIIVLDDAGFEFRKDPANWPESLTATFQKPSEAPWVILKISRDIAQGELWRQVMEQVRDEHNWLADRLIVMTDATCLREAGASISHDLSWERCAQDVAQEIQRCSAIEDLSECKKLIISFGPSGVMYLDLADPGHRHFALVFHHNLMERSWREKHSEGAMFGYGSALCATVAREIIADSVTPNIPRALRDGLAAMQLIYERGFVKHETNQFAIPIAEILKVVRDSSGPVPDPRWPIAEEIKLSNETNADLSILKSLGHTKDEILEISRRVALGGIEFLPPVPIGQFGDLVTVDRMEIEGLRAIYNLIANYQATVKLASPPLAIAVFGPPGTGKSYAVKQLIKESRPTNPDTKIDYIEFNLSQFDSASDLVSALHRVRDIALAGKVPLVFWDEFDTPLDKQPLGWLRYFLAPIQDGTFQQAETLHRIGASIFVFGGSQFSEFRDFNLAAESADSSSKVLDFLSRLRGYMNVSGIDQQDGDPYFMLQRAIILNSLLKEKNLSMRMCGWSKSHPVLDVQDGVLKAFLSIPKYKHGVRSMMAIIDMSRIIRPAQRFVVASLPSTPQLDMHVDGAQFLRIAHDS